MFVQHDGAGQGSGSDGEGTVYVLVNEAFNGLVKIGFTTGDLHERVRGLFKTGVPSPFEVVYAVKVAGAYELEQRLHRLFAAYRWAANREFFAIAVETAIEAIGLCRHDILAEVFGRPSVSDLDEAPAAGGSEGQGRRSNIDLAAIGINPGDILTFHDDPSVTATVARGNKVILDDETLSLSAAADVIIRRRGLKGGVGGAKYWAFDGELVDHRRRRLESLT